MNVTPFKGRPGQAPANVTRLPIGLPEGSDGGALPQQLKAALLSSVAPTRDDRQRVRQKLSTALVADRMSPSVRRVDAQMAAREGGVIATALSYGLAAKWAVSSLAISAALALAFVLHGSSDSGSAVNTKRAEPLRAAQPQQQPPANPSVMAGPSVATESASVERPLKGPFHAARVRVRPALHRRGRSAPVPDDLPESQLVEATLEAVEHAPAKPLAAEPAVVASSPDLAEELRLLRSASSALAAHQPAVALSRVRQHEARYPKSPLAQEAEALRVMALCELGEQPAARIARDTFLRVQPHSPLAERVRQACAGLP
jgi:hypothetical protein